MTNKNVLQKTQCILDQASDKAMEQGCLTGLLNTGDLAIISLIAQELDGMTVINIDLTVDNRLVPLSPEEDDEICDAVDDFLNNHLLKNELTKIGFDVEENFYGYRVNLILE